MNAFFSAIFTFSVVLAVNLCQKAPEYDLLTQIQNAKSRFDNDFLLGVWYRSNEAIVESREKLLGLYTRYTLQQAEQVIDHIAKYRNFTLTESSEKRDKVLATKNITQVLRLTQCIFKFEDSTIQAYKMTGYNLHNCIRMAQIETETQYLDILKNFEHIKNVSLETHEYFTGKVDNCLDKTCVIASLIQSVIHYEKLQEEIATNVTEINGINTRYLLAQIALGCVSNSIAQIEENYKIGKNLVDDCFQPEPETMNVTNEPQYEPERVNQIARNSA